VESIEPHIVPKGLSGLDPVKVKFSVPLFSVKVGTDGFKLRSDGCPKRTNLL
jgi:hypothetical protein